MNDTKNNNIIRKYKIVEPIINNKIYESNSFKKASKRCYNEIKSLKLVNVDKFIMKDIDTNQTYSFKIHTPFIQHIKNTYDDNDLINLINPINDLDNNLNNNITNNTKQENNNENKMIISINAINSEIKLLSLRIENIECKLKTKDSIEHDKIYHDDNPCFIL